MVTSCPLKSDVQGKFDFMASGVTIRSSSRIFRLGSPVYFPINKYGKKGFIRIENIFCTTFPDGHHTLKTYVSGNKSAHNN